jgi:prophage antirepressor-like protein
VVTTKRKPEPKPTPQYDLFGHPIEEPGKVRPTEGQVVLLTFEDKNIRSITIDGDPWWVAKDVCRALGIQNHKIAINGTNRPDGTISGGLAADESMGYELHTPSRGVQKTTIVNEAGLYRLIFNSSKDEAERFRKWVFGVLKTIRKYGTYSIAMADPVAKMQKRLKCDKETATRRVENVNANKSTHRRLAAYRAKPEQFAEFHNSCYEGQTGKNASELREMLGIRSRIRRSII